MSAPNDQPTADERPVELVSEGVRLFAIWHQPAEAHFAPVVFCHPFAEEKRYAHRIFVETARELRRRGFPVLRFDFRGCGDSEGEFTIAGARSDLRNALRFACHAADTSECTLLGLRLGATLAAEAAAPDSSGLIMWAPILSGSDYMRQTHRRKLIRKMMNQGATDLAADRFWAEETWDVDAYLVGPELREEISQLDLLAEPPAARGNVLLASVGPTKRPPRDLVELRQRYAAAGVPVELISVASEPFWSRLGLVRCPELIELTASWLEQHGTSG